MVHGARQNSFYDTFSLLKIFFYIIKVTDFLVDNPNLFAIVKWISVCMKSEKEGCDVFFFSFLLRPHLLLY